jgi:RNA polymerase sigma factor (sigma-70 family)
MSSLQDLVRTASNPQASHLTRTQAINQIFPQVKAISLNALRTRWPHLTRSENYDLLRDLLAMAAAKAIQNVCRGQYDETKSAFSTWVSSVALNAARDYFTGQNTQRRLLDRTAVVSFTVADHAFARKVKSETLPRPTEDRILAMEALEHPSPPPEHSLLIRLRRLLHSHHFNPDEIKILYHRAIRGRSLEWVAEKCNLSPAEIERSYEATLCRLREIYHTPGSLAAALA